MIRCPACGELLRRRRVGPTQIDGCASCGGVWLDRGELADLAAAGGSLKEIDDSFLPGTQAALAPVRSDACPRCEVPLGPGEYKNLPGVRLASCRSCKGVFLEHGQLGAAGEQLEAAAAATAVAGAAAAAAAEAELAPELAAGGSSGASRRAAFLEHPGERPRAAALRVGTSPSFLAVAPGLPVAPPSASTSTRDLPVVRGRLLPAGSGGGGLLEHVTRGFRFLKGAYALGLECPKLVLPVALGGGLSVGVLAAMAGAFLLGAPAAAAAAPAWGPGLIVVALVAAALGLKFVGTFTMGMTVSAIDAYLKGRTPELGVAFRDAWRNTGGLVALAAVDLLVSMITSQMHRRRSAFGLLHALGSAVESVWTVLSCLLLPAIMIEDVGLGTALTRVRAIHSRNLLQIGVGEVAVRFVSGALTLGVAGVVAALASVLVPLGAGGIAALLGVGGLLGFGAWTAAAFARASYYTSLYLWAAEQERAGVGARVMVPAPLAEALA